MTCYHVITDNSRFIHWENRLQLHINLNWVLLTRWHSMFIQNFCVTDQQLHTLIRLGISPPSFDTGARMKCLFGPQLNKSDKDFGWAEIWTRISQLRSRHSNHYSTSFRFNWIFDCVETLLRKFLIYGMIFISIFPSTIFCNNWYRQSML